VNHPRRRAKAGTLFRAAALAVFALVAPTACKDSTPPLSLSTITVTLQAPSIQSGRTTTATAAGVDQNGAVFATGTVA